MLFGSRTIVSDDPSAPTVLTVCPRCHREADIVGKFYRPWFTIFLLPIIPLARRRPFSQCTNCKAQFPVAADQLQSRLDKNDQAQSQEAIALYNSLRASPANSITLNQLMILYASMKEYDQALGAAADFPRALHSSEQCMATLGRVYLARGDLPNAIRWFDAAVTRNPTLGEAHYHKAVAHLMQTPGDVDRAVTSARAARKAGYPNSEALLREAQSKGRVSE